MERIIWSKVLSVSGADCWTRAGWDPVKILLSKGLGGIKYCGSGNWLRVSNISSSIFSWSNAAFLGYFVLLRLVYSEEAIYQLRHCEKF
jgi:hypothetical protein